MKKKENKRRLGGRWLVAFFNLEFLCKGRKYQLSRKPSTH